MADSDLIKLYSGRILELAAEMPRAGRLEAPDASVKRRSPLCGSTITVDVVLGPDGRIADYAQDVKACALGQASAALLGGQVIGRSEAEIVAARDQLKAMLAGDAPPPGAPFAGYEVLEPAREYRNRHASILLALEATAEAVAAARAKAGAGVSGG